MVNLILAALLLFLVLYVVQVYVPLDARAKQLLIIVLIVVFVLWALGAI